MEEFEENDYQASHNSEASEERPAEKRIFRGENYSDDEAQKESKKPGLSKLHDEPEMMELIKKRNTSREPTNVMVHRGDLIKAQTLGMSVSLSAIKPGEVKQKIKFHTARLLRVLNKYREIDGRQYKKFFDSRMDDHRVSAVYNNFYLLQKGFAAKALAFVLNSYDETGMCRLFQEFYLEFDENNDKKMQIHELEKCIEFLGKDNYIGHKKMVETLKEYNVNCSNSLSLFQEGNAGKILNDETLNKLFKAMEYENNTKKAGPDSEYVDFMKFAPMLSIFFFEYFVTAYLKKKELYRMYLGYPLEVTETGKAQVNTEGDPEGLYRVFIAQLKGETNINEPVVTFKDVTNALIAYRSSGFSDSITMEALERIMKSVKDLMSVDPVSEKESRKFTMKELLPILICKLATEMTWHKTRFQKSIEKYDKMVEWHGCALAHKLSKKNLHNLISDAFCNLPFPTFEQFVKGLDFILKRLIPTLVSPASIFIAKKLMKTPDTIICEEGFNGETRVRFNIKYIVKNDDLFERLFYYSTKFQIKLMFVRMLYKNFYPNYRREKGINRMIIQYNQIMTTFNLFEGGDPGKLGNFEDAFLNLLKIGDPEEALKEENERKEMKKKKFLEMLFNQDNITSEKKKSKMNNLRRKSSVKVEINQDVVVRRKKNDEKMKLDILLAEANRIDTTINNRENEKMKDFKRTKVSSAFPNSDDITTDIIMNLINSSENRSDEINRLKEFIYYEKETITFQDIQKFLIAQHLKKKSDKDHDILMNTKTTYIQKDIFEEQKKLDKSYSLATENRTFTTLTTCREDSPALKSLNSPNRKSLNTPTLKSYNSPKLNTDKTLVTETMQSVFDTESKEIKESCITLEDQDENNDEFLDENLNSHEREEFNDDIYVGSGDVHEFEEKYFKDFANRKRNEISKLKEKNDKNPEDKDRGCECVLS